MITLEIQHFDLQQIADSGQCFRMNRIDSEANDDSCRYAVISAGRRVEIAQRGSFFTFDCTETEFPFWHHYFDLGTDYGAFISSILKRDTYLQKAAAAGNGIRILNQDPWEMILTFVISQQKTIPKIREAVELLSRNYGTRHTCTPPVTGAEQESAALESAKPVAVPQDFFAFPDARQLSAASLDDLKALKLGYRAKYIHRLCQDCAGGRLDLNLLTSLGYRDAMEYLTGFYGIGTKVANCICLFGLHHIEAFPVDTWIEQILTEHYYKKKYSALPKSRLYETVIHDNFGKYKGYAGVMQQYIFYYERLCRGKL